MVEVLVSMLLLAGLAGAPDGPQNALIVDQVVARVDGTVLTQSALTAETRLVLLDARSPQLAVDAKLTRPLLSAVLRSMVHRALLVNEMRRLQLRSASTDEVRVELERLASRFESRDDFGRFLIDIGLVDPGTPNLPGFDAPRAIVERLSVEQEVQRFIEVRLRPRLVTSDQEVRACFEANLTRLGRPFEEVEAMIRGRLRAQKRASALEALLDQLERRARVRLDPRYRIEAPETETNELGFVCPEASR